MITLILSLGPPVGIDLLVVPWLLAVPQIVVPVAIKAGCTTTRSIVLARSLVVGQGLGYGLRVPGDVL